MADATAAHARELGDYAALARRRWAWIVTCVLVGGVLGFGYLSLAQPTYVSTAKVLVAPTQSSTTVSVGDRTNDAINLDTEAQLVKSEPVSTRAAALLGSPVSPVSLSKRVTVSVPPNTTVMAIAFAAPTAEEAQRGAAMFAQAYLENRGETAEGAVTRNVKRLEGQIEQTQGKIQDISVAIARLSGRGQGADRAFLLARRAALSQQQQAYNAELAPLVGADVSAGEVILEAQLPKRPVAPNPMLILPAGLMAGLVGGLALASWRERMDKRIHTGAELERLFGIVPLSRVTARGRSRTARIDHDVRAFYHSLRANGPESGVVTMLVGPDAGDTAERLAHSIAQVASRSGSATTFVTRPQSPVLLERRRLRLEKNKALDLANYEKLGVIVDGEFRSSVLRRKLGEISSERDFIILGLPNDDPAVDLPILGRHVDLAVVVVRLGYSRRDSVAAVLADLNKSGVDRVFAVTVDLGRRRFLRRDVAASDAFGAGFGPVGTRPATSGKVVVAGPPRSRGNGGGSAAALGRRT